jgi:hypothetical protein
MRFVPFHSTLLPGALAGKGVPITKATFFLPICTSGICLRQSSWLNHTAVFMAAIRPDLSLSAKVSDDAETAKT